MSHPAGFSFGTLFMLLHKLRQGSLFLPRIFEQRFVKRKLFMLHADLQKQEENANVDPVIPAHLVCRRDTPLASFLIAVNPRLLFATLHDPWLGIAGAGHKARNLDEAPMAYKGTDEIISHIGPTVDVVERIIPVYNFKAAE
ncbi:MAG: hypothetical protein ACI3V5_01755 [Faecousia sp.]